MAAEPYIDEKSEGVYATILLLIAHSPNRYLATLVLIVLALIQFRKSCSYPVSYELLLLCMGFVVAPTLVGVLSFFCHYSSLNNLFWALFGFAGVASSLLLCSQVRGTSMLAGLKVFIFIEACVLVLQYFFLVIKFKTIFVFSAFSGVGDFLSGTLLGFSSPLAVSLMMISLYFMFLLFDEAPRVGNFAYALLAGFISLFPGMMSAFAVYLVTVALVFVLIALRDVAEMRLSLVGMIAMPIVIIGIGVSLFFLGESVGYMLNIISLMMHFNNPPIKILVIQKYVQMISEADYLWLGAGLGNFTSRASAIVSGEYLARQPFFIPVTPSAEFTRYIAPYWNRSMYSEIVGGSIGNSMVNEPFNFHLSTFAESGFLGGLILEITIVFSLVRSFLIKRFRVLSFVIFVAGILLTNDWFAYPSFAMIFAYLLSMSMMQH